MQIQKQTKLFAFKLAEKQVKEAKTPDQWKVREGVSLAGCSGPDMYDNYRASRTLGKDDGVYC